MRQKWIEQCYKTGKICTVNEKDDRHFYATNSKEYDGRSTMYHVWQGEKWLICTPDYQLAARKFEEGEE